MTEAEMGYAAGIIDGESSICLTKHSGAKDCPRRFPVYRPHLTVSQTDIRLPLWFKERFGGYIGSCGIPKPGHKQGYAWQLNGSKRCLPFLEAVLPYLFLKTRQAQLVIDFCRQQKNLRRLPEPEKTHEFLLREAIVQEVKMLNRRGTPPPETKRFGGVSPCDSPISILTEGGEVVRNGNPAAEVAAMVTG